MHHSKWHPALLVTAGVLVAFSVHAGADEPPTIDPFGPRTSARDDAVPGYLELSDGVIHYGRLFLTRDARLKVFDPRRERSRDIPLEAIRRIDCVVDREWLEKEWRFKENANDQKVYTGRSYPVREYLHTITLQDGRTIQGTVSGIVYVEDEPGSEPERFLFHKRAKGEVGSTLQSLRYVRLLRLGEKALEEGKQKAFKKPAPPAGK
jgi:hypothetical protein